MTRGFRIKAPHFWGGGGPKGKFFSLFVVPINTGPAASEVYALNSGTHETGFLEEKATVLSQEVSFHIDGITGGVIDHIVKVALAVSPAYVFPLRELQEYINFTRNSLKPMVLVRRFHFTGVLLSHFLLATLDAKAISK